jgi:hypothetical protein
MIKLQLIEYNSIIALGPILEVLYILKELSICDSSPFLWLDETLSVLILS